MNSYERVVSRKGILLSITVDTEAFESNKEDTIDIIDHYIFGEVKRKNGVDHFGIVRMMDIADTYGIIITFFVDFSLYYTNYAGFKRTIAAIKDRKHDIQVHFHPDNLKSIKPRLFQGTDLVTFSEADANLLFSECQRIQKEFSLNCVAFRGGGWRYNKQVIDAMEKYDLKVDMSFDSHHLHHDNNIHYNYFNQNLKDVVELPPFKYWNDVIELPHYQVRSRCLLSDPLLDNDNKIKQFVDYLTDYCPKYFGTYIPCVNLTFHSHLFIKRPFRGKKNEIANYEFDKDRLKRFEKLLSTVSAMKQIEIIDIARLYHKYLVHPRFKFYKSQYDLGTAGLPYETNNRIHKNITDYDIYWHKQLQKLNIPLTNIQFESIRDNTNTDIAFKFYYDNDIFMCKLGSTSNGCGTIEQQLASFLQIFNEISDKKRNMSVIPKSALDLKLQLFSQSLKSLEYNGKTYVYLFETCVGELGPDLVHRIDKLLEYNFKLQERLNCVQSFLPDSLLMSHIRNYKIPIKELTSNHTYGDILRKYF